MDDTQKPDNAGTSRRGLLKCMAWAGTGIVWTVAGGIPRGLGLGAAFAAPMDSPLTRSYIRVTLLAVTSRAKALPMVITERTLCGMASAASRA